MQFNELFLKNLIYKMQELYEKYLNILKMKIENLYDGEEEIIDEELFQIEYAHEMAREIVYLCYDIYENIENEGMISKISNYKCLGKISNIIPSTYKITDESLNICLDYTSFEGFNYKLYPLDKGKFPNWFNEKLLNDILKTYDVNIKFREENVCNDFGNFNVKKMEIVHNRSLKKKNFHSIYVQREKRVS